MVSASMPSLPVSLKATRRTSPKRTPAGSSRWACRRSNAWRSPKTSVVLSPSWHPKTRDGSPAIPSMWTAAQSSEGDGYHAIQTNEVDELGRPFLAEYRNRLPVGQLRQDAARNESRGDVISDRFLTRQVARFFAGNRNGI